jgi:hypothetical protein
MFRGQENGGALGIREVRLDLSLGGRRKSRVESQGRNVQRNSPFRSLCSWHSWHSEGALHSLSGLDDNHESMQYRLIATNLRRASCYMTENRLTDNIHAYPRNTYSAHKCKTQNSIRENCHDLSVRWGHSRPRPSTSQQNA